MSELPAHVREGLCEEETCIEHGVGTLGCPIPRTIDELNMTEKIDHLPEIPSESNCPSCGSEPTDDSIVERRLSDMGYLHEDIALECSECKESWWLGVPRGDYEDGEDLWCESCEDTWMLVHRVDPIAGGDDEIELHLKCPNPECHHFKRVLREGDGRRVLVGYPMITGSTEEAKPYGYPKEADQ